MARYSALYGTARYGQSNYGVILQNLDSESMVIGSIEGTTTPSICSAESLDPPILTSTSDLSYNDQSQS